jgi:hypothetical protein
MDWKKHNDERNFSLRSAIYLMRQKVRVYDAYSVPDLHFTVYSMDRKSMGAHWFGRTISSFFYASIDV